MLEEHPQPAQPDTLSSPAQKELTVALSLTVPDFIKTAKQLQLAIQLGAVQQTEQAAQQAYTAYYKQYDQVKEEIRERLASAKDATDLSWETTHEETLTDSRVAPLYDAHNAAVKDRAEAALALTANFTEHMPDAIFAAIEPGKVPGRYDTPACRKVPLKEKNPHHADTCFNVSFIPWLPAEADVTHFQDPGNRIPVEVESLSRLDQSVANMIKQYLSQEGLDFEEWYNWCQSKQIRGASTLSASARYNHLEDILLRFRRKNPDGSQTVRPYTHDGGFYNGYEDTDEVFTSIPSPEEFEAFRRRVHAEHRGEDTIHDALSNVALIRWDRENNRNLYPKHDLLSVYTEFLASLELDYPVHERADYNVFIIAHSLPILVMGGRQEHYYPGDYYITNNDELCLDYLDAFFLVAAEAQLSIPKYIGRRYSDSPRCLFGSHENALSNPKNLLMTMATMYFRMDDWQKKVYERDIELAFHKVKSDIRLFDTTPADWLTVPGTDADGEVDHQIDPKHVEPAMEVSQKWQGRFSRTMALAFERGLPLSPVTEAPAKGTIVGYKPEMFENAQGTLASLPPEKLPEKKIETVDDLKLALSTRERSGVEVARIVETLLARPEDGNLDKLSAVTTMLEILINLTPENRDMFSLITWLGNLQQQASALKDVPRSEVEEILSRCAQTPEFSQIDSLSQLILIYSTFGFVPKEFVVEQILKSAQSATSLFTVRAALLFEDMRKKDLASRGIDVSTYVSPIFAARDSLKESARNYSPDSFEYRQALEVAIADVLNHISTYMEYDISVKSTLEALISMQHTGTFFSMCAPQAELLSSLINFLTDDPHGFTAYRELHPDMKIEQWFEKAAHASRVVDHEHVLAHADLPDVKVKAGTLEGHALIIDQTTGHIHRTTNVRIDRHRTDATKNSRVETYPRLSRFKKGDEPPTWRAVCYGARDKGRTSTLLGDLTLDFPQLRRYRLIFSPDELLQLRHITMSNKFTYQERVDAYRELVKVAPRVLGRVMSESDINLLGFGLGEAITVANQARDYAGEIFLARILMTFPMIPPEMKAVGQKAREHAFNYLITFSKWELRALIETNRDLLTPSDESDLLEAWEKEQERKKAAEIERQKALAQKEKKRNAAAQGLRQAGAAVTGFFTERMGKDVEITLRALASGDITANEGALGDNVAKIITTQSIKEARETVEVNVEQVLDKGVHEIPGTQLESGQKEKPPKSAFFYVSHHLIEVKPEVAAESLKRMLAALPQGADVRDFLARLQVVLLKAEKTHFGDEPYLVEQTWNQLEAAAAANNVQLPYTRQQLIDNFGTIIEAHRLDQMGERNAKLLSTPEEIDQ